MKNSKYIKNFKTTRLRNNGVKNFSLKELRKIFELESDGRHHENLLAFKLKFSPFVAAGDYFFVTFWCLSRISGNRSKESKLAMHDFIIKPIVLDGCEKYQP